MWRVALVCFFLSIHPAKAQTVDVPAASPDNVIVGFYNVKWFGHQSHDLEKLAQVIQKFDVCVVMEVKREIKLRDLHDALMSAPPVDPQVKPNWNYAYGMRSRSLANHYFETFAVFWNENRVKLGQGLVGGVWDFKDQFRHDPYIASFRAGSFDFAVMAVHTRWSGDTFGTRDSELEAIEEQIRFMANFLPESDIIVGGDFNYPASQPQMEKMATRANLFLASKDEPTTFKQNGSGYNNAYDHIYVTPGLVQKTVKAGALDTTKLIYGDRSPENMKRSRRELSDHLPVFIELRR